nr:uncharacterized protein LOC127323571 [Lolium perenne]
MEEKKEEEELDTPVPASPPHPQPASPPPRHRRLASTGTAAAPHCRPPHAGTATDVVTTHNLNPNLPHNRRFCEPISTAVRPVHPRVWSTGTAGRFPPALPALASIFLTLIRCRTSSPRVRCTTLVPAHAAAPLCPRAPRPAAIAQQPPSRVHATSSTSPARPRGQAPRHPRARPGQPQPRPARTTLSQPSRAASTARPALHLPATSTHAKAAGHHLLSLPPNQIACRPDRRSLPPLVHLRRTGQATAPLLQLASISANLLQARSASA